MLNQNIKNLRKQKGYTQETLAQELNIVRQTVSKWEKGYSVPDAVMLEKLAELFEVSVGELLGDTAQSNEDKADLNRISEQLAVLNNQLAKELNRKRKVRKIALIIVSALAAIVLITVVLLSIFSFKNNDYAIDENGGIVLSQLDSKLDDAVSQAVLSANINSYASGEFAAESHYVFGVDNKTETIKVYLLENYTLFGFKNGFFTDVAGGRVPVVMSFKVTNSGYELLSRETAQDGADYTKSIKELFPTKYSKKVLNGLTDEENAQIWNEQKEKAEEYLKSIGRTATVCQYSDIKIVFFSDYGIDDETSKKISNSGLKYDDTIGNHEEIENGKRYVYQTEYDIKTNQITFTKFEYDTNKVVEFIAVDGSTGEIINVTSKPEKATYYHGELNN